MALKKLAFWTPALLLPLVAAVMLPSILESRSTAQAAPTATVRIAPASLNRHHTNGEFEVRIELTGFNHHGQIGYDNDRDTVPDRFEDSIGLGAFEFTLFFDPNVVRITGGRGGGFLGRTGRSTQCLTRSPEPGEYGFGCVSVGSKAGPQGSGRLAVITIEPRANGRFDLDIEAELGGPLGDDISVQTAGATVRVTGAPTTAPPPTQRPPGGGNNGGGGNGGGNNGGGDSPPEVVGGGVLGDVTSPGGNSATGNSTNAANDPNAEGFPSAGASYQPSGGTNRPLVIGGVLALLGAAALAAGARVARGRS